MLNTALPPTISEVNSLPFNLIVIVPVASALSTPTVITTLPRATTSPSTEISNAVFNPFTLNEELSNPEAYLLSPAYLATTSYSPTANLGTLTLATPLDGVNL